MGNNIARTAKVKDFIPTCPVTISVSLEEL